MNTSRLIFEALAETHAQALFQPLQDPRLYEYIPLDPPAMIEELMARFKHLSTNAPTDGTETWLNWALKRNDANEYVGMLQATICAEQRALIAYSIFPPFWRSGYGREAVGELLRLLQAKWQIRNVEAHIDTRNTASIALVESLGFVRAATLQNADFFKGAPSHEHHYALRFVGEPR